MGMSVAGKARHVDEEDSQFSAYGPIETAPGYLLFYVLVDRVTDSGMLKVDRPRSVGPSGLTRPLGTLSLILTGIAKQCSFSGLRLSRRRHHRPD
jgi:hypothetical protein